MKKKNRLLSFVMIAISFVLIACGNGGDTNGESGEGDETARTDENSILVWSGVTGPDGELIQQNIDEYNDTNPEYPVELLAMEGGTLNNRLVTVTRSGEGVPDLALVASETVTQYAGQDLLNSWDEYIEGTEVNADNYLAEAWDVGTVDGSQYGLPATMGTWVMYYNQDLVDEYVPGALDDDIVTYEEVSTAGEAATDDGIISYGSGWPMQNFNNLYLQMGGQFSDDSGQINIDNDTAAATMEHFKSMYEAGHTNQSGEDAVAQFMNGETIFLPEGTWMLSQMEEIDGFEWGQTFTPQWDADNVVQASGASQFVQFIDENRPEERVDGAVEFVDWLRTNQMTWLESGENTASLEMLENEDYLAMPQSFLVETPEAREAITIVTDEGSSHVFGEIDTAAWDMMEGTVEIEDKLAEIQQIINDTMGY